MFNSGVRKAKECVAGGAGTSERGFGSSLGSHFREKKSVQEVLGRRKWKRLDAASDLGYEKKVKKNIDPYVLNERALRKNLEAYTRRKRN